MKRLPGSFILARNCPDGSVEYWTGATWQPFKIDARVFRTLQAVDRAAASVPNDGRMLYITE